MMAYEVSDGFDAVYCATVDDVKVVAACWLERGLVIASETGVLVRTVNVATIPEMERCYVADLRAGKPTTTVGFESWRPTGLNA